MIIADRNYPGIVRRGCSLKSGGDSHIVQIVGQGDQGGPVIQLVTHAGQVLAENRELPRDYSVGAISAQLTSGSLHPILYVYGFVAGASDQNVKVIVMDNWVGTPPVY